MSNFFKDFPLIKYDAFRSGILIDTINTTKRFSFLQKIMENATLFYPYIIKDGQRPDIVSDLIYGTVAIVTGKQIGRAHV